MHGAQGGPSPPRALPLLQREARAFQVPCLPLLRVSCSPRQSCFPSSPPAAWGVEEGRPGEHCTACTPAGAHMCTDTPVLLMPLHLCPWGHRQGAGPRALMRPRATPSGAELWGPRPDGPPRRGGRPETPPVPTGGREPLPEPACPGPGLHACPPPSGSPRPPGSHSCVQLSPSPGPFAVSTPRPSIRFSAGWSTGQVRLQVWDPERGSCSPWAEGPREGEDVQAWGHQGADSPTLPRGAQAHGHLCLAALRLPGKGPASASQSLVGQDGSAPGTPALWHPHRCGCPRLAHTPTLFWAEDPLAQQDRGDPCGQKAAPARPWARVSPQALLPGLPPPLTSASGPGGPLSPDPQPSRLRLREPPPLPHCRASPGQQGAPQDQPGRWGR
ncbi:basic salivary proline-rich protein 1-like [Odocoileus virginianus]|uniref:Basic salivary proline-rich protein 1-like n=1 Tax=Odocoileus virginianus TaxID=9874 RepID=A0ABM4J324_ODOVR